MFFCTEKWAFSEHKTLYLRISWQPILLDGVPLTGEEGVARQHQAHQVALGAAAGEDAGVARRKTDQARSHSISFISIMVADGL